MAQSINQRIVLVGSDEVKRALQEIAAAGKQSGDQIKTSFENTTRPVEGVTKSLSEARLASNNMRIALLEFEGVARGTFDGLASGSSILRVAAQQAGRFAQAIQFAGGPQGALSAFRETIGSIITPTRLALGGIAAVGAAVLVLGERIRTNLDRVRTFQSILVGLGRQAPSAGGLATVFRGGQGTVAQPGGQRLVVPEFAGPNTATDLNKATQRLQQQLLITRQEAANAINKVLQANINPTYAEQIVRIGENISVLGHNTNELTEAVKAGVPQLQQFARTLNIDPRGLNSVPAILNAIDQRTHNLLINSLDPINRQFRQIEVGFSQTLDNAASGFQSALVKVFNTAQKFPINFPKGFKNLVGTANAFDDLLNSLADATGRAISRGIANFHANADAFASLGESLKEAVVNSLNGVRDTIRNTFEGTFGISIQSLQNSLVGIWTTFENAAVSAIGAVSGILSSLIDLKNRVFSSTAALPVATAAIPAAGVPDLTGSGGFANGGRVFGPGSGTSDSILARISNGEYIVNAAATRMNLPLLNAINSMSRPARSRSGFAAGGFASLQDAIASTAPGSANINSVLGRTRFTLVIEGRQYADISAPNETANNLLDHARTSNLVSLGPSPSWRGGR